MQENEQLHNGKDVHHKARKSQLTQTDPRDALHHANRILHERNKLATVVGQTKLTTLGTSDMP